MIENILEFELSDLKKICKENGEKEFRAKQIYEWLHKKLVSSFDEMTNLSKEFRDSLKNHYVISPMKIVEKQVSKKDETSKYLFLLEDGNVIESVLMKYKHGNSVCISSQIGCKMGCSFCASTLGGLMRNLTSSEMLSQIYEIQRETGERVSNVIVMGIGEPFDNYDNLIKFIKMLSNEDGLNISQRNITVSTCGLVPKIYELAKEHLQITLAISLHAPNDEIRKSLMPVANKYTIKEILEACQFFINETNRRITFEYSMIHGINDKQEHAKELSKLLKGYLCHVNLIPLNDVTERNCTRSNVKDIQTFKIILEKNRINVTIRREMGSDIDAACGQLRKKYLKNENAI